MKTEERIIFRLLAVPNDGGDTMMYVVHPSYEGASLKWSREGDEQYFIPSLDGEFTLLGDEADIIDTWSIYTKFWLVLFDKANSATPTEICRGSFRKTDCKTDRNHRSVTFSVEVKNPYTKLNDKIDDEYNVVSLGLEKRSVKLYDYPVAQLVVEGDSQVVVFTRNTPTTASIEPIDLNLTDATTYRIGVMGFLYVKIPEGHGIYSGTYTGYVSNAQYLYESYASNYVQGVAKNANQCQLQLLCNQGSDGMRFSFRLWNPSTQLIGSTANLQTPIGHHSVLLTSSTIGNFNITVAMWRFGTRVLFNSDNYSRFLALSSEDFYPCAKEFGLASDLHIVAVSENTSSEDTGYGKVEGEDYYYDVPSSGVEWIPIGKDSWFDGVSFWSRPYKVEDAYITAYRRLAVVKDFYTLGDVIKGILAKIDDSIVFESDSAHSQFLFGDTNPIDSGITQSPLYITQKSNILNLQYDYPAWRAPLKFSQILTFLRNAFNCYYDIYEDANGDYHFRIEHVSFYLNGGSYTDNVRVSTSLKQNYDSFNGKPLSFLTNRWSYNTENQASRYEFGWMDTQSEVFSGYPIIVPDAYRMLTTEQKETRTIDWFSSDVEFLVSVPAECSSDGFCVVRGVAADDDVWVEEGSFTFNGSTYVMQNMSLAFVYLHQKFMLYNLYAEKVYINDNTDTPQNVTMRKRLRTAEVTFVKPRGMELTPLAKYTTEAGSGIVDDLSVDLSDMKITANLLYETEQ